MITDIAASSVVSCSFTVVAACSLDSLEPALKQINDLNPKSQINFITIYRTSDGTTSEMIVSCEICIRSVTSLRG